MQQIVAAAGGVAALELSAGRIPMPSALSANDRMTRVLVAFIHRKARSIADEITRVEAVMRAIPEVTISGAGASSDPAAGYLQWQLHRHLDELKALASVQAPRLDADCAGE